MAILGTLLKKGIKISEILDQEFSSPHDLQKHQLKKLLLMASNTAFGDYYQFTDVLRGFRSSKSHNFYDVFTTHVPVHSYNSIFDRWWRQTLEGKQNVCWPGKVKYFALSSGTSEASSKYIPITKEMVKAIRKTSIRQILTLSKYDLPDHVFEKGILMLGGSTHLNYNGRYFTGDLSGITASQIPFWFQHFYKPGKKISKTLDWNEKLMEITEKARDWDIGIIVGVPAWIQILLEKIISYYQVKHIHEIWPNLSIYVHGGISFEPYRKGFLKLLGKPLEYIETYLASEGFIAFQASPQKESMRLVLNNGMFYEFIPFNETNFHPTGELKEDHQTLMIDQVAEGEEYALLLSSCAGAWRYLIGDVIKFTALAECEIVITGRTKHFLSFCGEHLSVDNMNKAVSMVSDEFNIEIKEFTVAGVPYGGLFGHHWYVGTDNPIDPDVLRNRVDAVLKEINDDYRVERSAALKKVFLTVVPTELFYKWMKNQGKEGGQNKFPRVMRKAQYEDWVNFLQASDVSLVN